jgi:hypothetical protein
MSALKASGDLAHHPFGHTIGEQANRKVSLLGCPKCIP